MFIHVFSRFSQIITFQLLQIFLKISQIPSKLLVSFSFVAYNLTFCKIFEKLPQIFFKHYSKFQYFLFPEGIPKFVIYFPKISTQFLQNLRFPENLFEALPNDFFNISAWFFSELSKFGQTFFQNIF